jgi:predicted HicB family RNase H-like nuclease
MREPASSSIVTRTTIDIDPLVLRRLKERQRREGKSLGRLVSELLAASLVEAPPKAPPLAWTSKPMGARVDLEDHEAVRRALDEA